MLIQYISDVHLEHMKVLPSELKDVPVVGEVLALCGDIGSPTLPIVREWIGELASKFMHVLWVPGNHEYYNAPMDVTDDAFRDLMQDHSNLHVLNDDRFDLDGITFLGTTLWSDIDTSISKYINDYRYIERVKGVKLSPHNTLAYHRNAVKFIDDQLTMALHDDRSVVVLSHHGPHPDMNGKYKGEALNSAFCSNLQELFRHPLKLWVCGHTHQNMTMHVNGIPCTANCLGYPGEGTNGVLDAVQIV